MESSDQNRPSMCETIYPASFWQVGLSELVLSKYFNKSPNFKNFFSIDNETSCYFFIGDFSFKMEA